MEQDTSIDPQTGKMRSAYGANDGHQNDHYARHSDPQATARDYSRPRTIPKDEFEAATGQPWDDAVAAFDHNEAARKAAEAAAVAGQAVK